MAQKQGQQFEVFTDQTNSPEQRAAGGSGTRRKQGTLQLRAGKNTGLGLRTSNVPNAAGRVNAKNVVVPGKQVLVSRNRFAAVFFPLFSGLLKFPTFPE